VSTLSRFETLFNGEQGRALPLSPILDATFGTVRFPNPVGRAHVVANFVASLDGVVALGSDNAKGGGEISGFNQHDAALMGLLRAAADAVVVGNGTLRSVPRHLWTAQHIYPPLGAEFAALRSATDKPPVPLNVVVTASGNVDLTLPVFSSGKVPALVVTGEQGMRRLKDSRLPAHVRLALVEGWPDLSARQVIRAVEDVTGGGLILVEGGPHLMGRFFAEGCLDELFLTVAPQVAGRDDGSERPGFVAGTVFGPVRPYRGHEPARTPAKVDCRRLTPRARRQN
jgi:riboflavin biosynthesis pyrimidine reductase